jgi:effector-binding domain-containing protein
VISDPCKTVEQAEQPVLSVRTVIPVQDMPAALGKAFGEIFTHMGSMGEQPAGMPFVAYYNMDMKALDIEIGFPASHPLPGKDSVQPSTIPAGLTATCEYTGPYEELSEAYNDLTAWVEENGYQPTGVVYEYYLNGPEDAEPSGYKTRIVFPLKA